jgi:hypothetical protein
MGAFKKRGELVTEAGAVHTNDKFKLPVHRKCLWVKYTKIFEKIPGVNEN